MSLRCRLCLETIEDQKLCVKATLDNAALRDMIQKCLPELDMDLIPNPVLCKLCHAQLTSAYTFRTRCIATENELNKYLDTASCFGDDVLDQVADMRQERTQIIDLTSSSEDDDDEVLFLKDSKLEEDIIDHVNSLISRALRHKRLKTNEEENSSEENAKKVPPLKLKVPGTYEPTGSYVCDLCPTRCSSKFAMYEHYQLHWQRKKLRKRSKPRLEENADKSRSCNKGLWCYCKRKDDGSLMINCDNKHCEIKWFHMRCTLPKKWFCDRCTARSASIDLIPE